MKLRQRIGLCIIGVAVALLSATVAFAAPKEINSTQTTFAAADFDDQAWLITEIATQVGHEAPFTGEELAGIQVIRIVGEDLSGCYIPMGIRHLKGLHTLELGGDKLEGDLTALDDMNTLAVLDLKDNRFSGRLPALSEAALHKFDVSNNYLSGDVPFYYLFSPGYKDDHNFLSVHTALGPQLYLLPSPVTVELEVGETLDLTNTSIYSIHVSSPDGETNTNLDSLKYAALDAISMNVATANVSGTTVTANKEGQTVIIFGHRDRAEPDVAGSPNANAAVELRVNVIPPRAEAVTPPAEYDMIRDAETNDDEIGDSAAEDPIITDRILDNPYTGDVGIGLLVGGRGRELVLAGGFILAGVIAFLARQKGRNRWH